MSDPEKCFYCDAPATRYCDFKIGAHIGGFARVGEVSKNQFYACVDVDKMPHRCDMPICEQHSVKVGSVFMKVANDTIDYCPEHVGADELRATPCTEEEANTIRCAIRVKAKRRLLYERNFKPGADHD